MFINDKEMDKYSPAIVEEALKDIEDAKEKKKKEQIYHQTITTIANYVKEHLDDTITEPEDVWRAIYNGKLPVNSADVEKIIDAIYETDDGYLIFDMLYDTLFLKTLSEIASEIEEHYKDFPEVAKKILQEVGERALEKHFTEKEIIEYVPEIAKVMGLMGINKIDSDELLAFEEEISEDEPYNIIADRLMELETDDTNSIVNELIYYGQMLFTEYDHSEVYSNLADAVFNWVEQWADDNDKSTVEELNKYLDIMDSFFKKAKDELKMTNKDVKEVIQYNVENAVRNIITPFYERENYIEMVNKYLDKWAKEYEFDPYKLITVDLNVKGNGVVSNSYNTTVMIAPLDQKAVNKFIEILKDALQYDFAFATLKEGEAKYLDISGIDFSELENVLREQLDKIKNLEGIKIDFLVTNIVDDKIRGEITLVNLDFAKQRTNTNTNSSTKNHKRK